MIDSGANEHVVSDVRFFETVESICTIQLELEIDTVLTATSTGTMPVHVSRSRILFTNVHYISDLQIKIKSSTRFDEHRITTAISTS